MPPSTHSPARYVAMKDSWSHSDDRRERGRVDRGVTRQRRSRSPDTRRPEGNREPSKARERSPHDSRSYPLRDNRPRSPERRRRVSRSPPPRDIRDDTRDTRERNRGRELLDTRISEKPKRSIEYRSPSSSKRRKTRTPSPTRSHHKKPRKGSRSPSRLGGGLSSSRSEKRRQSLSPPPPQKRSAEPKQSSNRAEGRSKHRRDSRDSREPRPYERRGRSPSPKYSKNSRNDRPRKDLHIDIASNRTRSPHNQRYREQSPLARPKDKERVRDHSGPPSRRSPDIDRYEPNRSRPASPRAPQRGQKPSRGRSPTRDPGGKAPRDEYRPGKPNTKGGPPSKPAVSGANSIEVKGRRGSGANSIEVGKRPTSAGKRPTSAASGPNSIEVKTDKMAGRGFYGNQQGYNPNQQMQAAFPLKPQYNQVPQHDPRQYSQSPQHMTPGSYHGSPAQSPYSNGRSGSWGPPQQQFSPQQP